MIRTKMQAKKQFSYKGTTYNTIQKVMFKKYYITFWNLLQSEIKPYSRLACHVGKA